MELKDYIVLLSRSIKKLILSALLFAVLGGLLFYYLPERYVASGAFFVSREVETPTSEVFNYEGYYAQQAALSYAKTFAAIIQSIPARQKALSLMNKSVNEPNLRNLKRDTTVKTEANLVTLSVTATTQSEAANKWGALSTSALELTTTISGAADPKLKVVSVSATPVIHATFRNLYVNVFVGLMLGLLVGMFLISFFDYLHGDTLSKKISLKKGSK